MRPACHALLGLAVLGLAACSGPRRLPGDDQPTLASLPARDARITPDAGIQATEEQTIAAYRDFLAAAPQAPQRAEVLRRLGDLEMDRADRVAAAATGAAAEPDYRAAIAQYEATLLAYPDDPQQDRLLYQLARAQEQGGRIEAALQTLDRLVARHPGTVHAEEAHFRRGELMFSAGRYAAAEAAYATVLASQRPTPLRERALYMQGWSRYKQGRLDEALASFFGVLDLELGSLDADARDEADLAALPGLSRAERELVEDTLRVSAISLSNLQGADSVARHVAGPTQDLREGYQFRVYRQLAELYLRQDRIKDAADTYAAFVRRQPLHAQAPLLQARVIEILEKNGFEILALQAKQDHVLRYGAASDFRRANPAAWARAQPLVQAHLRDLAHHHHALAQKSHAPADVDAALRWYRTLLAEFADDADAPAQRFLMAELLFEDHRWAEAASAYEAVAYATPAHARSADAGYAALLAQAEQLRAAPAAARPALQRQAVEGGLRFAQAFPGDARAAAVLTDAAERLFALGEGERASSVARQALATTPPPADTQRRSAWTVIAHHAFEAADYANAEAAYREVLALDRGGTGTVERLAAAIYRQGEQARDAGDARAAVAHFQRIGALAGLPPASAVRASAQVDAAAVLIGLRDWEAAAHTLEDFRRDQPGHPLQAEVAPKLALAYLELKRGAQAADELERVAAAAAEPALARGARWQAAELRDQAAASAPPRSPLRAAAVQAYERYLQQYPQPLEPAVQARWRLAALAKQDGQAAQALAWTRAVQQADLGAGAERTPRTRALGGAAALALAEPVFESYRQVALVEPLARQLKLKKAKLEDVLRAYAAAAEVGVAEVATAATFHTAALYQDFGQALLASARPRKLSKAEREQYDVMLEEQAFPFEEKAIALHEANAGHARAGVWDDWVQRSYAELARLKPARYAKPERGDPTLPADLVAIEAALQAQPQQPRLLNQLGIALRRAGRFDAARRAYEDAIALDAGAAAPLLNLAILHDLYRGDAAAAQPLYQRCVELSPADAPLLTKWLAELKSRKPLPAVAALTPRQETP